MTFSFYFLADYTHIITSGAGGRASGKESKGGGDGGLGMGAVAVAGAGRAVGGRALRAGVRESQCELVRVVELDGRG